MRKVTKIESGLSQTQFLYNHLRGTGRSITSTEASKIYGIKRLSARMSELRNLGLQVNTKKIKNETQYSVSARDLYGSRKKIAV